MKYEQMNMFAMIKTLDYESC